LGGQTNPYRFNLDADGMSDTVIKDRDASDQTLILNALAIRDLVEEALIKSNAVAKATPTGLAAAKLANQYSDIYEPVAARTATDNVGMANDIWFGAAAATVDGEVFSAYAVVTGGRFTSLIINGTREVDGEVVLINTLGDAEFTAVGELADGKDDFYETIGADIKTFLATAELQTELVDQLADPYDFTTRGAFGVPALDSAQTAKFTSRFGSQLLLAVEAAAKPAIDDMVRTRALAVRTLFQDRFSTAAGTNNTRAGQTPILYSEMTYTPVGYPSGGFQLTNDVARFYSGLSSRNFSRVTFESSDRNVLDVNNNGVITTRRIEADSTATITMTLEFDDQVFTYSTYNVYTIASYNRMVLNALHTDQGNISVAGVRKSPDTSVVFDGRTVLLGASVQLETPNNGLYTDYTGDGGADQRGLNFLVRSGLLIRNTNGVVENVAVTDANWNSGVVNPGSGLGTTYVFGYYRNYGLSTQEAIGNLSELPAGTHTITAAAQYGTELQAPLVVTRRFTVTIITQTEAATRVLSELEPANLLSDITTTAAARLDNTTSVIGVAVRWSLLPVGSTTTSGIVNVEVGDATLKVAELTYRTASLQQQLTVQRNYTDQKFVLRADFERQILNPSNGATQVVANSNALTGTPQRNYELTVKAATNADVQKRIVDDLTTFGLFTRVPLYIEHVTSGVVVDADRISVANAKAAITSGDNPSITFEIAVPATATSYYVLPANADGDAFADLRIASLSGITHYVVMITSGAKDTGSGIYDLSGLIQYGATAGATGDDVPFMQIDVTTGELELLNQTTELWPIAANSGLVQTFPFTVSARVRLSTDTDPATFQVNVNSISKDVILYKNPYNS
jgi:hypothetical protein